MLTGQDILALRKSLGMTPTKFAALVGVCSTTVWLWETNKRHPKYETMRKLNDMLAEASAANGKGRKAVAR